MYSRYRMVNPLLGVYYGIFTAGFIGIGLLLLILEYMGTIKGPLLYGLPLAAMGLGAAIAIASMTQGRDEFFISGRRVPAGLNGLVIVVLALGGAGLSGLTGALFFWGVDGFGMMMGFMAGILLSGVLFAAFVRKAGGYTLASFFELRYQSRPVGVAMGFLLLVPAVCFGLAELALIQTILPALIGINVELCLLLTGFVLLLTLLPGGVRSMSWTQCAFAIVLMIGLLLPLILIALKYTNLPLAPFTYGSLIDDLGKFEALTSAPAEATGTAVRGVFDGTAMAVSSSFLGGARPLDLFGKLAMFFLVMAGVAAMPAMVMRSGVTSTAYQARKSYAWGTALMGFVVLTLPAYVVFFRYMMFDPQANFVSDALPGWAETLSTMGLARFEDANGDGTVSGLEMQMGRDGVFLGLPMIAGSMETVRSLTVAALLAAAMASLMGRVMAIANCVTRDFHLRRTMMEADVSGFKTLVFARVVIGLVVVLLVLAAYQFPVDPFQCFIAGLTFCALGLFPQLVVSIWSRGGSAFGLLLGAVAGFLLSGVLLFLTAAGTAPGPMGLDLFTAGFGGLMIMLVVAAVLAQFGPRLQGAAAERLNDIRTPGGEAIYDRQLRSAVPRRPAGRA